MNENLKPRAVGHPCNLLQGELVVGSHPRPPVVPEDRRSRIGIDICKPADVDCEGGKLGTENSHHPEVVCLNGVHAFLCCYGDCLADLRSTELLEDLG